MDFAFSEEQNLLHDSVRRFVAEAHDFEQARIAAGTDDGFSRTHWATFAELGWLALMVPEERDGLGGSYLDAAIIMEKFGRGLVAAPYLSSAILGVELISAGQPGQAADNSLERLAGGELLFALACEESQSRYDLAEINTVARRGPQDRFTLSGRKIVVVDGASADVFAVTARYEEDDGDIAVFWVPVDTPGLQTRRYRTIDGRCACDLAFDDLALPGDAMLMAPGMALDRLEKAIDGARMMLAAEAIGLMDAAVEITGEYLKTRSQFGRVLSSFQVLTHRLSDMVVKLEHARSMVFRGLAMLDAPASQRSSAVSASMVAIIQASEFVTGHAIQLHGGIGMTEESAIGHYYKRVRAIGKTYGDLEWHMNRFIGAANYGKGRILI